MDKTLQSTYIEKEALYGASNYSPLPVVLEKGEGAYLWDIDGNKYLDMMSAYSAVSHGHSHPELVKTLHDQAKKLAISSRAFYTEPFAAYIEKLSKLSGFSAILPMNTGAEAVETAIKAARRAGSIITRASEDISSLTITSKNMNDFVSEVDIASEKEIIRVLKQAYPDYGFIAEESGLSEKKENMWIIDPLDGTTNFLHNIPQYCVSIALKQKDEITHAVVYDPNRNDLFTASKGQGAYLNDRRMRVSKTQKLQDSIIGTGIPFRDFTYLPQYLVILEEIVKKSSGIRRPGSAALDLAYVAAGWFDGFWEIDLSTWDVAAGGLLVSEAGGIVSDFDEKNNWLLTGNIVATNPKIYDPLIKIIQQHVPEELRIKDS